MIIYSFLSPSPLEKGWDEASFFRQFKRPSLELAIIG
jgi:hypothetical protein